jgi:hypothetical protein
MKKIIFGILCLTALTLTSKAQTPADSVTAIGYLGTKISVMRAQDSATATVNGYVTKTYLNSNSIRSIAITGNNGITVAGSPLISSGTFTLGLSAIPNSSLANSTISGIALGGNLNNLTNGYGINTLAYNGAAATPISADTLSANGLVTKNYFSSNTYSPKAVSITATAGQTVFTFTGIPSGATVTFIRNGQVINKYLSITVTANTVTVTPSGFTFLAGDDVYLRY